MVDVVGSRDVRWYGPSVTERIDRSHGTGVGEVRVGNVLALLELELRRGSGGGSVRILSGRLGLVSQPMRFLQVQRETAR